MDKSRYDKFFNRELSWVQFNSRVMSEAFRDSVPLLEQLKFLAIVSSNLDEFFMVRVASLKRQNLLNKKGPCPAGMTPLQQLEAIEKNVRQMVDRQYHCLNNHVLPALVKKGLKILKLGSFTSDHHQYAEEVFDRELMPVLTPLKIEDGKKVPCSGIISFNLAFQLNKEGQRRSPFLSIVQIPSGLSRFRFLRSGPKSVSLMLIEDIIADNGHKLFPGYIIDKVCAFRITRDADLSVNEARDEDFMEAMAEVITQREHSNPVRMEISTSNQSLRSKLSSAFNVLEADIYKIPGPLDLKTFMSISGLQEFSHLCYPKWQPRSPRELGADENIWEAISKRDLLLHHPYESFDPIIQILTEASIDPNVLAIKMTLYRTSGHSPIVKALMKAAENGIHVTVLVEIKARFDESQNLVWAQQLEQAGAIVLYGIVNLKVHSKIMLIVRREPMGIKRYVHLATGNYNEKTAGLYVDLGLFTTRDDIAYECSLFFNSITGYSEVEHLTKLFMAPFSIKPKLLNLIQREMEKSTPEKPGLILAKMNSLSDPDLIKALYRASRAGVKIQLNIRGICILVPGVKNMSSNIRVVSIIDRYLEHSRIFYFQNDGKEEAYLSSADWMPRNMEKRIELMFPIESPMHITRIKNILNIYFTDNTHAHTLNSDGTYTLLMPGKRQEAISAQVHFHNFTKQTSKLKRQQPEKSLKVRRTPPKL